MRKRLLYFRKSVVLGQAKILVSMFSGKGNNKFLDSSQRPVDKGDIMRTINKNKSIQILERSANFALLFLVWILTEKGYNNGIIRLKIHKNEEKN